MAMPIIDVESFKAFLRDRARETWTDRRIPYYLSFVATDLKRRNIDYHTFTGPFRLVQWATNETIPDTKLVSHPTIKAKVGLLPSDVEFDFSTEHLEGSELPRARGGSKHGQALIKFVESLGTLPEEVAGDFNVPAKVLVALLKH